LKYIVGCGYNIQKRTVRSRTIVSFNINGIIGLLLESLGKGDRGQEAYCNRISSFSFFWQQFFFCCDYTNKIKRKKVITPSIGTYFLESREEHEEQE